VNLISTSNLRVVLDTNTVLDWLVFRDRATVPLAAAIETRQVCWISSAAVRSELGHVLDRGVAAEWRPDLDAIEQAHKRHALDVDQPPPDPAERRLRCTDGDDQKFIELAVGSGARWLVTRDKALLRLARKAAPRGLLITTPARWTIDS